MLVYWELELKTYAIVQGYLDMKFHVEKLMSISTIFDLEQFYSAIIASLIVNSNY